MSCKLEIFIPSICLPFPVSHLYQSYFNFSSPAILRDVINISPSIQLSLVKNYKAPQLCAYDGYTLSSTLPWNLAFIFLLDAFIPINKTPRSDSHHLSIGKMKFYRLSLYSVYFLSQICPTFCYKQFPQTLLSSHHVLLKDVTVTPCWWLPQVYTLLLPGYQAPQYLSWILHSDFSRVPWSA